MKGRMILLDHIAEVEAAALMVDGQLDDLLIDSDTAPRPGTIYRALADRPVKGQGGMFLKTPDGSAFLRQVKGLSPGQPILVQVTGYAEDGKAIPVTQKILFKSRYVIVTPDAPGINVSRSIRDEDLRDTLLEIAHGVMDRQEKGPGGRPDMGLILRSSCAEAEADDIALDIETMTDLARAVMADTVGDAEKLAEGDGPHALAWRDWADPAQVMQDAGCFAQNGVLEQINALESVRVPLSGGGALFIEPTRALVAVDVNTGPDTSLAAGIKANMAAAKALPRQLRLRGLGGQIVLDLAPMPKKDRRVFETSLRAAFRSDQVDTALVGWTPLGHYELQRKRARIPTREVLT